MMVPAVLTADQNDSRTGPDLVPAALESLSSLPHLRPFERTTGDELQGILDDPVALTRALELLIRAGRWNVGVGFGPVEEPLPDSTRAARGEA
ncbi:MAG: transposase, partial [Nocardioides sp.]|nr:transposase [Nocardioides sp.]